ncbi:hypothetical protein SAMN06309944_1275 [Micrococcales bacterium KH10]|nr:hypothetical protein SAMN06309944_1275 [Micrococcales bacterium KH10]
MFRSGTVAATLLALLFVGAAAAPSDATPNPVTKFRVAAKSVVVAKQKSRVAVTVRFKVNPRAHTAVPITVRIKIGKKVKRVRAEMRGESWQVKTKVTAKKPKKVVVRVLGMKKTKRIAKVRTKSTLRIRSVSDGSATRRGKRIAVAIPATGAPVRLSGTLRPAFGRRLLVQRRQGSTWSTQAVLRTSNARKVTWSATFPATAGTAVWRVRASSTVTMKALTLTTVTVTPQQNNNRGGPNGNNPGGNEGNGSTPPISWQPGQRNCFDRTGFTNGVINGEVVAPTYPPARIPGCRDYGPATVSTVSTIMGVKTPNDQCGVTITCWRDPTPAELERGWPNTLQQWSPPPAVAETHWLSTDSETMYVPTLVDELNMFAVDEGWITQAEIDQYGPPYRHLPEASGTWTGFPSMTAPGHGLVPGQGGPAQQWVDIVATDRTHAKLWMNADGGTPRYSSGDGKVDVDMNFTQLPSTIGRHSPSQIAAMQGAWRDNRMEVVAPIGNPNYNWSCGEQTWSVGGDLTTTMSFLDSAHYNGLRSNVTNYKSRGYQGPYYMTVGGKRWPNGRGWVILSECLVSEFTGTDFRYHTLPGDPHHQPGGY